MQLALAQTVLGYLLKHFFKKLAKWVWWCRGWWWVILTTPPAIWDGQLSNHSLQLSWVLWVCSVVFINVCSKPCAWYPKQAQFGTDELEGTYDSLCKTSVSFQHSYNLIRGEGRWGGRENRSERGLELKSRALNMCLLFVLDFFFCPTLSKTTTAAFGAESDTSYRKCSWAGHSPWHLNLFICYSGCYKRSSFWGEEGNDRSILWKQLKLWSSVSKRVLSPPWLVGLSQPAGCQELSAFWCLCCSWGSGGCWDTQLFAWDRGLEELSSPWWGNGVPQAGGHHPHGDTGQSQTHTHITAGPDGHTMDSHSKHQQEPPRDLSKMHFHQMVLLWINRYFSQRCHIRVSSCQGCSGTRCHLCVRLSSAEIWSRDINVSIISSTLHSWLIYSEKTPNKV